MPRLSTRAKYLGEKLHTCAALIVFRFLAPKNICSPLQRFESKIITVTPISDTVLLNFVPYRNITGDACEISEFLKLEEASRATHVSRMTEPQSMRVKSVAKKSARLYAGILISLRPSLPACIVPSSWARGKAPELIVSSFASKVSSTGYASCCPELPLLLLSVVVSPRYTTRSNQVEYDTRDSFVAWPALCCGSSEASTRRTSSHGLLIFVSGILEKTSEAPGYCPTTAI